MLLYAPSKADSSGLFQRAELTLAGGLGSFKDSRQALPDPYAQ